jgi:hypothetical protein
MQGAPALISPAQPERRTKSGTKKGSQKLIGRLERPHQRLFSTASPSSGEASASGSIEAISRAIASMSTAVPWRTLNGFIGARPYVHRSPLIKSPHVHLSNWIGCAGPSQAVARIVLAGT